MNYILICFTVTFTYFKIYTYFYFTKLYIVLNILNLHFR